MVETKWIPGTDKEFDAMYKKYCKAAGNNTSGLAPVWSHVSAARITELLDGCANWFELEQIPDGQHIGRRAGKTEIIMGPGLNPQLEQSYQHHVTHGAARDTQEDVAAKDVDERGEDGRGGYRHEQGGVFTDGRDYRVHAEQCHRQRRDDLLRNEYKNALFGKRVFAADEKDERESAAEEDNNTRERGIEDGGFKRQHYCL
jgi:hypothetical protein